MRRSFMAIVWRAVLPVVGITLMVQNLFGGQVTLTWDPVSHSSLQGYKVYYGTASRKYTASIDVKNVTTYTINGLNEGAMYYFAATAYSSSEESALSDEVTYAAASCSYSLSSNSASFESSGDAGNVAVNAPSGCAWNTSGTPAWLNIMSGAAGTGKGSIVYSVAPNNDGGSRTANLTIAGQAFTLSEAGASHYTVTASAGGGGSISPSGAITVTQGSNQSFTITPQKGFFIYAVQVDGQYAGPLSSYTFYGVGASHEISVVFAPFFKWSYGNRF